MRHILAHTWMTVVAQDGPALSLTGDSAGAPGLVTALRFTPLLLTLWAGGPADRYGKRRLLPAATTASGPWRRCSPS
jgi:hypothetical protein